MSAPREASPAPDARSAHSAQGAHAPSPVRTTAEIRAHFPALERRRGGVAAAYLDGPGGTQVPREVVEAMADYLFHHNANTHWVYPTSVETDATIARARATLADFLNAAPEEIAFGANMTTLAFHLARALGRGWGVGDEVVVTELDHQANVAPWTALARERGLTIRVAPLSVEQGTLDLAALERLLGPRTRLLAIGAASNALGTIPDVAHATRLAHQAGALVFVDAVHYAPHRLVDVRALDCDFLACSAYKFYGPHIGVLYGRRALLEALDVPKLLPAPDTAPERLETGTQNHEGMVGAAAAVDFLASLTPGAARRDRLATAFAALHARGARLAALLLDALRGAPGVRLVGPPPGAPRTPTVAFAVDGVPAEEVARRLAARELYVSHGDFYATTVLERLGHAAHGLVRVGFACYSTEDDVERLIRALREDVLPR